ncbi:MAG: DUF4276 family protein [Clostridium sp.]|uniref:DUF4276 family protein n=1 Tax=Clostridium sp. TaxID=1506 RepID=UPI003EE73605
MGRVLIVVEGQTEEKFVKDIMIPYFHSKEIYGDLRVTILPSSILNNGKRHKGGVIKFESVVGYVKRLINSADYVTTLLDYYGIDREFRGYKESLQKSDIKEKKELIEKELELEIMNPKFIPYIQMHEFEGLLFSNPDSFIYIDEKNPSLIDEIKVDISRYLTPEHINDSPTTAPSKRLEKYYEGYSKTIDGLIVAEDIGIATMKKECPLFKEWIEKIERCLNK